MPLIPLAFPPGFYRNGTPYTRKARLETGNLVRHHNGAVRPIGGWQRRQDAAGADLATLLADPDAEAIRDVFAWRSLTGGQNVVLGSNSALYFMDEAGTVTDVTYGGYVPNNTSKDASSVVGFGLGLYGVGPYGRSVGLSTADLTPPDRWYFDNFGETLLVGAVNNGDLYELDTAGLTLTTVSAAPVSNQDICVTDQRQVFAVGTDGEPRRVRASDIENFNDWTPATNNQAINRVIQGRGKLLRCINIARQVLILGEMDAHAANYVGPPFVYSVDQVGDNCGLVSQMAVAATDKFAVWWGERNFWLYDGTVQVLPCEVSDFVYSDLNPEQISKITAFTNAEYNEIWWLYQSSSSETGECDSYVVWDYLNNAWYTGKLDRTAGHDKGVLRFPLMVSSAGAIYNHEQEDLFPEDGAYVESGPIDITNGETNTAVRYIYPDTQGDGITFSIIGRQFPTDVEYTYGPYANTNPVPTRAMGRSVRLRADFSEERTELGVCRIDVAPSTGKR